MQNEGHLEFENCNIAMVYVEGLNYWSVHFNYDNGEKFEVLVNADNFEGDSVLVLESKS